MPWLASYLYSDCSHGCQSFTRSGSMSTTPLAGNPGSGTLAPQFSRCWPDLASMACRKYAGEV